MIQVHTAMSGVRNSKKIITCKIFITCSISRVVMWTWQWVLAWWSFINEGAIVKDHVTNGGAASIRAILPAGVRKDN